MMKEEFVTIAKGLKMPLLNDTIGDEDYKIVENLYYVMDIDKHEFVKVVKAIGLEMVITKRKRWAQLIQSEEHYNEYQRYIKAKDALDEQQRAVQHSKKIIENYERKIKRWSHRRTNVERGLL